jgi:hypothetical protein
MRANAHASARCGISGAMASGSMQLLLAMVCHGVETRSMADN